jgi:hypothetical protein
MNRSFRATLLCVFGHAALACSGGASSDAGAHGTGDAGLAEAESRDSGDASSIDAGDAGSVGSGDTGSIDAGADGSSLLLVAAGGVGTTQPTMGFSYDLATDTWSAGTPLGDGTNGAIDSPNGAVSFAFTGNSRALAVLTDATDPTDPSGASGPVQFATWTSGMWTPFATVGSGVSAFGAPSLAIGTESPEIAFAGDTTKAESSATLANGNASEVTKLGSLTGGPPSLAARGADATVAYIRSSDGALVAVDRTSGIWGTASVIESGTGSAAATSSFAPSLVALDGTGAELMVVYTDTNMTDLHFATRTVAGWSPVQDFGLPTKVVNNDPKRPNPGAGDSPSPSFPTPMLALSGGKAILAFTSVNQYVYVSQFDGTNWSTATSVFVSWGLDTIDSAQAGLAAGIGTATAEVVFGGSPLSSGLYVPYHTRLIAGQWTAPKNIIATIPGIFAMYALARSE